MITQAAFLVAIIALACFLLTAAHALLSEGVQGIRHHKGVLYLTFSVYVLTFVFYLVTQ